MSWAKEQVYRLLSHILIGKKKEHYKNKYKKLKKARDPSENVNTQLNAIKESLTRLEETVNRLEKTAIFKFDQTIGIADTNTWYLTHINKNVCKVFQYMTGIELNKDFVMEREVIFNPKDALVDHYNRYHFAAENIKETDFVADIACACGYGSSMLAEKAKKVIGVDIFKPVVDFANKIYATDNLSFVCQDAQDLLLAEKLDAIVSFETIEHIPEPDKFLKKAYDLIKDGGKLICSVPNETTRPFAKEGNSFHYRHYTCDQFKELLAECGFEITSLYQQYPDNDYAVEKREEEGAIIVAVAVKKGK